MLFWYVSMLYKVWKFRIVENRKMGICCLIDWVKCLILKLLNRDKVCV